MPFLGPGARLAASDAAAWPRLQAEAMSRWQAAAELGADIGGGAMAAAAV
jgi:hypothetical protein